jgi:vesicle transport protein SEC22
MVKTTIIARVADGLPLAASMDDEESADLTEFKNQAKMLFKQLSGGSEQRCSLDSPPFVFQYQFFIDFSYIIEFGVCYLCLCDKSYPKKLAFQYLEELQTEFHSQYGNEMQRVARPYAFVKFGMLENPLIKTILFKRQKNNTKMLELSAICRR